MEPVGAEAANYPDVEIEQPTSIGTRPIVTEQLVHIDLQDERIQDVIGRIIRAVKSKHADAEFVSYIGTNPLGIYVEVYTDTQEFKSILDILDDKLGNLHTAAGVSLCIVPRKKARAAAA